VSPIFKPVELCRFSFFLIKFCTGNLSVFVQIILRVHISLGVEKEFKLLVWDSLLSLSSSVFLTVRSPTPVVASGLCQSLAEEQRIHIQSVVIRNTSSVYPWRNVSFACSLYDPVCSKWPVEHTGEYP
jgi:hypothetical protein